MARRNELKSGDTFNRLTFLNYSATEIDKAIFRCSCGNKVKTRHARVRRGVTKSCGCLRLENNNNNNKLTNIQIKKRAIKKLKEKNLTLIKYKNKNSILIKCLEHGIQKVDYSYLIASNLGCKECGQQARVTKWSIEDANLSLKKLGLDKIVSLKKFSGNASKATLIDIKYGEYEIKEFRSILRGKCSGLHPKRKAKKLNKIITQNNKKYWTTENRLKHSALMKTAPQHIKKTQETLFKRYGSTSPLSKPGSVEKAKKTMLDRYGVDWYSKSEEGREITRKNNKTENFLKACKLAGKKRRIKLANGKSMLYLAKKLGKAYSTFQAQVTRYGLEHALAINGKRSGLELIIEKILKTNNINFLNNKKLGKYIPDFILPEYKIIIEADGLYWHSDQVMEDKNYHKKKKDYYKKCGYRSFFFREDEIIKNIKIIESMILNACTLSRNKIFARKCELSLVSSKEARKFLINNHLMGCGKGKVAVLMYKSKIVACMQFKKLNDNSLDIVRYCNKKYFNVLGGFSRLLKFLERLYKPKTIVNFLDLRYGEGKHLKDFNLTSCYLSFRWVVGGETVHRMKYLGNSGYEIGASKIWDCGQAKYVKEINYGTN